MSDKHHSEQKSKAWYRYPMVWFIIALPTIVVIASIITVIIAHKNAPQLIDINTSEQSQQSP